MLAMLRDLIAHKGHANAAMLRALEAQPAAASDPELWALLHHVLLANRFWLLAVRGDPFALADESRVSERFADLVQRYARSQAEEAAWIDAATEADLARTIADPMVPGGACSVAQALMQVCLHTHGHRAQCAKILRRHGSTPPMTDFILWLTHRDAADWPDAAGGIR